jgi:SAM-dependent methyltransferase
MKNKNHWYDGRFYDVFIAPNQDLLFQGIKSLISENATIVDVGCGTGRFSFSIAEKCKTVLGIDLSIRNINKAQQNLDKDSVSSISFQHKSLNALYKEGHHFDYAVITFVIHEINENERISLLKEVSEMADIVIIGDYLAPGPKDFGGYLTRIIEFLAGREHYRNYLNFIANGGIPELAGRSGVKIINTIDTQQSHNQIYIISKS